MKIAIALLLITVCAFAQKDLVLPRYFKEINSNITFYWEILDKERIHIGLHWKGDRWAAIGFGKGMTNSDIITAEWDGTAQILNDRWSLKIGVPQTDDTITPSGSEKACTVDIPKTPLNASSTNDRGNYVTFTRLLDTKDPCDVLLKEGSVVDIIWALGKDGQKVLTNKHAFVGTTTFTLTNSDPVIVLPKYSKEINTNITFYWEILNKEKIHIGLHWKGDRWASIGFGKSMTNSDIITAEWEGPSQIINDRWSLKHGIPQTDDTITPSGSDKVCTVDIAKAPLNASFANDGGNYITFTRLLDTKDSCDILLKEGTIVDLIWALGKDGERTLSSKHALFGTTTFTLANSASALFSSVALVVATLFVTLF